MSAYHRWRAPTREEFPLGMAEIAKVIGEAEAGHPSWTRRLAISEPDGQWCVVVDDCADDKGYAPWTDETLIEAFPLAYPLAEGVAILQSPDNPETELERRRQAVKEHNEEQARASAERAEAAKRQREEDAQLEQDRNQFRARDWERLSDAQKLSYALALKVQARDPDLAADLREVAAKGMIFPRVRWWA
jgi:hypothetical protein